MYPKERVHLLVSKLGPFQPLRSKVEVLKHAEETDDDRYMPISP